jgi:hypothetical protein
METSASPEARSAPSSYPTAIVLPDQLAFVLNNVLGSPIAPWWIAAGFLIAAIAARRIAVRY